MPEDVTIAKKSEPLPTETKELEQLGNDNEDFYCLNCNEKITTEMKACPDCKQELIWN